MQPLCRPLHVLRLLANLFGEVSGGWGVNLNIKTPIRNLKTARVHVRFLLALVNLLVIYTHKSESSPLTWQIFPSIPTQALAIPI